MNPFNKRVLPSAVQHHDNHNPDPSYLRTLLGQSGISQNQMAKRLGVSSSTFRSYLLSPDKRNYRECPYLVQLVLELLAENNTKHPVAISIDTVYDRFFALFKSHGYSAAQIPSISPINFGLTLDVLNSKELTLAKLTPQLFDWLSETFGVQAEWLSNDSCDQIYPVSEDYKSSHHLLKWIFKTRKKRNLRFWLFRDTNLISQARSNGEDISMCLLISEDVVIGNKTIQRFRVSRPWRWNYDNARFELKAILRVLILNKIFVRGVTVSENELKEICSGRVFLEGYTSKPNHLNWSVDRYVSTPLEDIICEDQGEILQLLSYMEFLKYDQYFEVGIYGDLATADCFGFDNELVENPEIYEERVFKEAKDWRIIEHLLRGQSKNSKMDGYEAQLSLLINAIRPSYLSRETLLTALNFKGFREFYLTDPIEIQYRDKLTEFLGFIDGYDKDKHFDEQESFFESRFKNITNGLYSLLTKEGL